MKVSQNKVVSLTYELSVREGEQELLVERVSPEQPFLYLHGAGGLPPKFEESLENLSEGESFDFMLSKDDSGYGDFDETAIVDLPKSVFVIEGGFDDQMIAKGNYVPMTDQEGNRMQGLVLDVTEEFVKMDFNHPLASKDLYFRGSVSSVREATTEEIEHGHVHGEGGHQH